MKDLSSNRPIVLTTFKKAAFTLAEDLITLGIIGIVAAITVSSIKHIRYAGYAQTFLKTYSEIQQAHNNVVSKYGDPSTWPFTVRGVSVDDSGNEQIASWYMDEFKTTQRCMKPPYWNANECSPAPEGTIKRLSGEYFPSNTFFDPYFYSMLLPDGRLIQIGFREYTFAVLWGYPKLFFTVDVNGRFKKPNQLGRDIFLIAMDTNSSAQYSIQPIIRAYGSDKLLYDTCKPDSTGYSCSENIIRDQAMKY